MNHDTAKTPNHIVAEPYTVTIHIRQTDQAATVKPVEHGGPKGLEPTRYGDWEKHGRCIDF